MEELAGAIAGVLGAGVQVYGTERTNAMNKALAEKQMRFQERMSSTAYQRGMADMKKAGLNPMLAYSQGGASAPTGTMATMENPFEGVSERLVNSASFLNQSRQVSADIQQKKTSSSVNKETAKSVAAQTDRIKEETRLIKAKADKEEVTKAGYSVAKPFVDKAKQWVNSIFEGGKTESSAKSSRMIPIRKRDLLEKIIKENSLKGSEQRSIR